MVSQLLDAAQEAKEGRVEFALGKEGKERRVHKEVVNEPPVVVFDDF